MANLKKQVADSGFIVVVSRLGLNTQRRTNTHKKREANEICVEITRREDQIKKNPQHPFWREWSKKEQSDFVLFGIEPRVAEPDKLTVVEACERYVESRNDIGKAYNTVEGYRFHLRRVCSYFATDTVDSLNSARLQTFVNWLNKQTIKSGRNRGATLGVATQKKIIDRLKAAIKWNVSQGVIDFPLQAFDSLAFAIEKHTVLDELEKWCYFSQRERELKELGIDRDTEGAFREIIYSKDELNEHLEYLKQKLWNDGTPAARRLFVAVLLCSKTGARRSELARVRVSDVRLDDLQVVIWRRKGRKNKDLIGHRASITEDMVPYLRGIIHQLPEGQQSLFCSDDEHIRGIAFDEEAEQSKATYLTKELTKALRGSKYSNAVGWHKYRHTLASVLLAAGNSREAVMETIGWCSQEMANRYSHLASDRRRAIIESAFAD